jgi:hypothetical protein
VQHQDDRLVRHDGVEPGIQVPDVVGEAILPVQGGAGAEGLNTLRDIRRLNGPPPANTSPLAPDDRCYYMY